MKKLIAKDSKSKKVARNHNHKNKDSLASKISQNVKFLLSETFDGQRSWEDFLNEDAFMLYPSKEDYKMRLAITLLEWAEKSDGIDMAEFSVKTRTNPRSLRTWKNEHKELGQAYEMAKTILGVKRKKGAAYGILNKDMVLRDAHWYDEEEHKINLYHKEMKTDEEKGSHTFNINITRPDVTSPSDLKTENEELQ